MLENNLPFKIDEKTLTDLNSGKIACFLSLFK